MEEHIDFLPLMLVLVLAFFVPIALARLRWLPVVVGEIMAGAIVGVSGLGIVGESSILDILSNIGLAFLMFLAGLEIDFNRLFPRRVKKRNGQGRGKQEEPGPNLLLMALVVYLLTLALAVPGGFLLNRLGLNGNPWLLAFILSATSLGVLLPVLKQRGLLHTMAGQAFFFTALLADFVTVLLLTLYVISLSSGLSLELLSVGVLFVAFFLVYRLGWQFFRLRRVRTIVDELSHVTVQIKVRGAIAVLMAFVVLASLLGVELILGAFLAGMIISLLKTPEDTDLTHKLEAFGYGFFIPVFFILVGANLDLRSLVESPRSLLLLPVLLLIALAVKTLPSLLFRRIMSWRETIAGAVLLNTHLSLEIAVAVIGLRLNLISPAVNVAIILFAVLTVLLMPVIFNVLSVPKKEKDELQMLILNANDLGMQVARVLKNHGERVRFIEQDPRLAESARKAGFEVIQTDSVAAALEGAGNGAVKSFLVLSSDDRQNLEAARDGVEKGIRDIVGLVNDAGMLPEYRDLGVRIFAPILHRPTVLAIMARSPDVYTLLTSTTDDQDIREVILRNPSGNGRRLSTLGLPGNLLVLSICRDGELIIPHGNTNLEPGDRLTIAGHLEELEEAASWLESRETI
jgi:Kef-type K+ transport system membrane component KefB/Trk K+ transport system NAD-binding subunit